MVYFNKTSKMYAVSALAADGLMAVQQANNMQPNELAIKSSAIDYGGGLKASNKRVFGPGDHVFYGGDDDPHQMFLKEVVFDELSEKYGFEASKKRVCDRSALHPSNGGNDPHQMVVENILVGEMCDEGCGFEKYDEDGLVKDIDSKVSY